MRHQHVWNGHGYWLNRCSHFQDCCCQSVIPGTYELLIADVERAVKQNDWMIAKLCLTPALNYIPGCPLPFIIFTNGTSFGNYDNFNLKSPQDAPHSHLGSPIGRSLAITRMNQPPDPESRVQLWIHLAWHILNQLLVFMPVWMNADGPPPLLPATYRMIFTCSEVSADRSFCWEPWDIFRTWAIQD